MGITEKLGYKFPNKRKNCIIASKPKYQLIFLSTNILSMSNVKIEASWKEVLKGEFSQPYFQSLATFLRKEKAAGKIIYPPGSLIFNAFNTTPFDKVKVVILGQDPYKRKGQAMGLSFSVPRTTSIPGSLRRIYKELQDDLGCSIPAHGDLTKWAEQGVFLLNATLTLEAGNSNSHSSIGWQTYTDAVIRKLSEQKEHLVFILWGRYAQKKKELVDISKHLVLESPHPSPYTGNAFFGHHHFSKTNDYLKKHGIEPIDWQIE